MYASNDAQRRVFVHCAFPVFLIALYLPLTERDSQAQQNKTVHLIHLFIYFIYLFGVLRRFQHYTGHITMGSWKGRGNQYIQFVRVLYCKLPTNGKQLPAFPLQAVTGIEPRPQRWEASVTTLPPWPPQLNSAFRDRKQVKHNRECQRKIKVGMPW